MESGFSNGLFGIIAPAYFVLLIVMLVSQWKVFEKAGKPGWAAIIPIYGAIVYLEIIGKPWWWLLLMFIPFVNFVYLIWMVNLLSKSFGKDAVFTVGLILLSFIFLPILAFGGAKYIGSGGNRVVVEELPLV